MNLRKRLQRKIPDECVSLPSDPDDSEVEGDLESDGNESNSIPSSDESLSEDEEVSLSEPGVDNEGWTQTVDELVFFDAVEKNPGIVMDVGNDKSEMNYFLSIFREELLDKIVVETNIYAMQKSQGPLTRRSSIANTIWTDITKEELKAWIGIHILMAIHQLPQVDLYWSSDPALRVDYIANIMIRDRFKQITAMIHLNDNRSNHTKEDPNYDKLHKVRPVIEDLNKAIREVYKPSNLAAVDESMIPFKGRSSLKQYNPMKPIKRGYKVWCRADSKTGFVSKFEVYTGKSNSNTSAKDTLGERVVLNMTQDLQQTGALVAFDNFFTTVSLMSNLHSKGIFSVGTVRSNRKGLPPMLKEKKKMQRGDYEFRTQGVVTAIKWMDSKPVTLLSSAHDPTVLSEVSRKNKKGERLKVSCPLAIASYNEIMGAVDKFDQLKERYAIGRRSRKWWHRIFYFLIDLAIVNSYIMYKVDHGQDTCQKQLDFRIHLAKQLIGNRSFRKRIGRPVNFLSKKQNLVPDDVRTVNVGKHLPKTLQSRRRCRLCSTEGAEVRTKFLCEVCNVPLCIDPCFRRFHEK